MTPPGPSRFSNRQIGVGLLLLGAGLFSCKAVVIKLTYQAYPIPSISLLGLRMAFSLPLFLLIGIFRRERSATHGRLRPQDVLWVILLGVFGYYLASYTDFLGLKYLTAGMERLILFIYPTLVLVLQRLIFGTPIKRVQWVATGVCYLGITVAFSGSDLSLGSNFVLGAGLIFFSAFLYSVYVIGSGRLAPRLGTVRFTSLALVTAGVAVLIHVYLSGNTLLGYPPLIYAYGLTLSVFCTVIPSYMVTEGVRRIGANDAAILGAVGPVATIVLEYFVLGETLSMEQGLGAALVITGVVMIGRSKD